MTNIRQIPLFPLGVVLFPQEYLPLYIFEERYRLMINECLAENIDFGIVFYDGKKLSQIGCSASIDEVLKTDEENKREIITLGKRRFKIINIISEKPYITAEVEFFDDESLEDFDEIESLTKEGINLLEETSRIIADKNKGFKIDHLSPKDISFLIAANAGFSLLEKQAFLEITDTKLRLEKTVSALKLIIQRIIKTKEIQHIITGNGHILGI